MAEYTSEQVREFHEMLRSAAFEVDLDNLIEFLGAVRDRDLTVFLALKAQFVEEHGGALWSEYLEFRLFPVLDGLSKVWLVRDVLSVEPEKEPEKPDLQVVKDWLGEIECWGCSEISQVGSNSFRSRVSSEKILELADRSKKIVIRQLQELGFAKEAHTYPRGLELSWGDASFGYNSPNTEKSSIFLFVAFDTRLESSFQ